MRSAFSKITRPPCDSPTERIVNARMDEGVPSRGGGKLEGACLLFFLLFFFFSEFERMWLRINDRFTIRVVKKGTLKVVVV